jgi:hypothetical protein
VPGRIGNGVSEPGVRPRAEVRSGEVPNDGELLRDGRSDSRGAFRAMGASAGSSGSPADVYPMTTHRRQSAIARQVGPRGWLRAVLDMCDAFPCRQQGRIIKTGRARSAGLQHGPRGALPEARARLTA